VSDISLAVDDGARRMTYAELAGQSDIAVLGATPCPTPPLAPTKGNDGVVRVIVPLTALTKRAETAGFHVTATTLRRHMRPTPCHRRPSLRQTR